MPILPLIGREYNRLTQDAESTELQQTINTNPWKEIERTVRRVDEEKVKDCTEDIDALLVFAGLYSAVLTAFLIESYKNLQADPTLDYLRQIALQTSSYKFNNGYLNATFSSSQFPPFQASKSDIRVNVCWFASLMLSLSSASFGILVKQWLREFLSISYISPQERIRIRDARVQGLEIWKLFEIASLLPILLQISLALFFVGLCFFTAAVHSSIGTTSLFLVTCWAFFFILSVIAPLVSSRCPYKTTSLKAAFRHARPPARFFVHRIQCFIQAMHQRICVGWLADSARPVFRIVHQATLWPYNTALELLPNLPTTHEADPVAADNSPPPTDQITNIHDFDEHINSQILRELSRYTEDNTPPVRDALRNTQDRSHNPSTEEEDKLRSAADNDLIIFSNIDASFFDDTLLTVMREALQRRPHPLRDTLRFVTQVFQSRLGFRLSEEPIAGPIMKNIPWPWTLSCTARYPLVNILADAMDYELHHGSHIDWKRLSHQQSEWSTSFAFIVSLFDPQDPIPTSLTQLFGGINSYYTARHGRFSYNPLDVFSCQMRTLAQCDSRWPARSLLFLSRLLSTLKSEDAVRCMRYISHRTFVVFTETRLRTTYYSLLREHNADDWHGLVITPTPQRIVSLLDIARIVLHKYTLEQTQNQDKFPPEISELLAFAFNAIAKVRKFFPKHDLDKPLIPGSDGSSVGLYRVLTDLFTTPHTIHSLLNYFTVEHPDHLLIPTDASYRDNGSLFADLVGSLRLPRDESIAALSTWAVLFEQNTIQLQRIEPNMLLRVCYLIYKLTTYTGDDQIQACWHRMFAAAATCFKNTEQIDHGHHDTSCQDEHEDACNATFVLLNKIHAPNNDCHEEPNGKVLVAAAIARSQVPDVMINVLKRYVCSRHAVDPETGKTFWRIKRSRI